MSNPTRRNLLKGAAASTPVIWAKPAVQSVVLPAHAAVSGAGCIVISSNQYVNFNGGNFLPGLTIKYDESDCTGDSEDIGLCPIVYAPAGEAQAISICSENGFNDGVFQDEQNPDIWECGCS